MKLVAVLILLFSCTLQRSQSQERERERDRIRAEKLEDILRIQDSRTPFDSRLVGLLSDDDPVVRRRATLAYGSLQDTAAIGLLTRNLTDPDSGIQQAAAFALGQTGTTLSEHGRQSLEYDLIWKRIPQMQAPGRLIEEIGKFGTGSGLNDLITRIGNVPPVKEPERLMMSIARFAIRGIVTPEAVRYLVRFIQPGVAVPWRAVYALQRIGDNPEIRPQIEFIRLLSRHRDPLVRMNAAALLGKLRDTGEGSEVLQRMADHDNDWRVRVNALRALGNLSWKGNRSIATTFKRAFFDAHPQVSITALSVFPLIGIDRSDTTAAARETLRQLAYIAENASGGFPWQIQAEAATALTKIDRSLPRGLGSAQAEIRPKLRARLLLAAGESQDTSARRILLEAAAGSDPVIAVASLEGLRALAQRALGDRLFRDTVIGTATRCLKSGDVAIATTSASLLGDSVFLSPASVPPLLETLAGLRPPQDTEAMQEILATLGRLNDRRALEPLLDLLVSPDPAIALAAASALRLITGTDYSRRIQRKAEPLYIDLDFKFLGSLKEVTRIRLETSRGDVEIDLYKEAAPFTIMSFLKLAAQRGFYRGVTFHRVVPNFVVQGGDPRGDGWGGPGFAIRSEFSMLTYETGTVGIASAGKDTEGSQFFITHSPQPHLDGRYTIIGKVVSGMDVVHKLQVDDRIYDILVPR